MHEAIPSKTALGRVCGHQVFHHLGAASVCTARCLVLAFKATLTYTARP